MKPRSSSEGRGFGVVQGAEFDGSSVGLTVTAVGNVNLSRVWPHFGSDPAEHFRADGRVQDEKLAEVARPFATGDETLMDRCAMLVDAGYLLGAAGSLLGGATDRGALQPRSTDSVL